jgi:CelD/BcsL family acetyltransferase involved in cellulose biosynthesis
MRAAPEYRTDLLRSDAELQALEPEWRALYASTAVRNPFWSYEWMAACRSHVAPRSRPYILTARRDGRLVGVAPLRLERELLFRVLRFVGDRRSDYQGFLVAAGEPGVERLLLDALAQSSHEWDLALLRQLTDDYTALHRTDALPASLRSRGSLGTVSPCVRLPDDWAQFCKDGPSAVRRAARAERKFRKRGGTVERIVGEGAVQHLDTLALVEARSWKLRRGMTVLQSGARRAFYQQLLAQLAPRGELEVWLARMDGRPVAFLINLRTPDKVWFYLGSYDASYRSYFPGGVLHYCCLQQLWEAGLREYDLLNGDEAYKFDWANATRTLRYRALFPDNLRGALAYAVLLGARWWLKRSPRVRAAQRALGQAMGIPGRLRRVWQAHRAGLTAPSAHPAPPPREPLPGPPRPAPRTPRAAPSRPAPAAPDMR